MTILNLGCGGMPMGLGDNSATFINHDLTKHSPWVDWDWDLNVLPWFNGYKHVFDEIYMIDVLEHLEQPIKALEECWRLLKPDGLLHLRVPYGLGENSMTDPTHKAHFMPKSMDYFVRGTEYEKKYSYYSTMRWKIISFEHGEDDNLCWVLEKDVANG